MAEPLKNLFNKPLIAGIGMRLQQVWPPFDRAGFVSLASKRLGSLELKQRSVQIAQALGTYLPDDYEQAVTILLTSLAPLEQPDQSEPIGEGGWGCAAQGEPGLAGWAIMPLTHYVSLFGLGHFDLSMALLKEMTKRFSSEFDIRTFLLADSGRALALMQDWTQDANYHVRRLVSEGSRPRLPWAMQLPDFITDPSPILPLLEALKDDPQEYVRRSVANSLNDIAKDHPDLVAKIATQWLKEASDERQKLVRHACRTLIKQGHQKTLSALGYSSPKVQIDHLKILTPKVLFGQKLEFELSMTSTIKRSQALVIDYAVHHRKANGSVTPKVFKWKTTTLKPLETQIVPRKHPMRKITTRVYYPGTHHLEILVNGTSLISQDFELLM